MSPHRPRRHLAVYVVKEFEAWQVALTRAWGHGRFQRRSYGSSRCAQGGMLGSQLRYRVCPPLVKPTDSANNNVSHLFVQKSYFFSLEISR